MKTSLITACVSQRLWLKEVLVEVKQIMFQSSVIFLPIMSTAEKRTAEDDKEEVLFFKLYFPYNHMNTPTLEWIMIWFMVLSNT